MKKILSPVITGFLSTYALMISFHAPLHREYFSEFTDYFTASVYEILGSYSFVFFCLWILLTAALYLLSLRGFTFFTVKTEGGRKAMPYLLLSLFFSFTFTVGKIFTAAEDNLSTWFSLENLIKAVLVFAGFALLIRPVLMYTADAFGRIRIRKNAEDKKSFWQKGAFIKSFRILAVFYLPFLILSLPGNLCYDSIGQINQVLNGSFNAHHPLIHTLFMGGFVFIGEKLFSSPEAGLFAYVVIQTAILTGAFAASIAFLANRKVKDAVLWLLLALYCFTPLYTNLSTTAIKDVPYAAFFLLYLILYCEALFYPELLKKPGFHIVFAVTQIGVITMRNNGLYVVALSGTGAFVYILVSVIRSKNKSSEDGKQNKTAAVLTALGGFFLESVILSEILILVLTSALGAGKGSRREMFSLPFQQTAYYLSVSADKASAGELAAIEKVLGTVPEITENYDKNISDPVKALYKEESSAKDLLSYFGAWMIGGIKHPVLYTKAFLVHTYGWYSPVVSNEIRYETDYDGIKSGMLFAGADKVMIFLYRFTGRFVPLAVTENVGLFVWGLFFLTVLLIRAKKKEALCTLPLWVSFLICLASPCFLGHPRYALPVFVGLPFCILYAKIKENDNQ